MTLGTPRMNLDIQTPSLAQLYSSYSQYPLHSTHHGSGSAFDHCIPHAAVAAAAVAAAAAAATDDQPASSGPDMNPQQHHTLHQFPSQQHPLPIKVCPPSCSSNPTKSEQLSPQPFSYTESLARQHSGPTMQSAIDTQHPSNLHRTQPTACSSRSRRASGESRTEDEDDSAEATAMYLSANCLLISYIGQSSTEQAVQDHFTRALSQPSSFSREHPGSRPSWPQDYATGLQHPQHQQQLHHQYQQSHSYQLHQPHQQPELQQFQENRLPFHQQPGPQQPQQPQPHQPHHGARNPAAASWSSAYHMAYHNQLSHYYQPMAACQNPYPTYYPAAAAAYSSLAAGAAAYNKTDQSPLDAWTSQAFRQFAASDNVLSSYAYQHAEKKLPDDPWRALYNQQHQHHSGQSALTAPYSASPYSARRDSLWLQ